MDEITITVPVQVANKVTSFSGDRVIKLALDLLNKYSYSENCNYKDIEEIELCIAELETIRKVVDIVVTGCRASLQQRNM